jgi:hypothetical protein
LIAGTSAGAALRIAIKQTSPLEGTLTRSSEVRKPPLSAFWAVRLPARRYSRASMAAWRQEQTFDLRLEADAPGAGHPGCARLQGLRVPQ